MEQARKRLSLALVLEDEDNDSNEEENANYEYSLFNYKPKFCDMRTPLSASAQKLNSKNVYVTNIKSQSSATLLSNSFTSLTSSVVDVEELENYVKPRDFKKKRNRTKSFSPGSNVTKYELIRQKYQSRQNTTKSRLTSSSLSTASSSSSVSSSSPRSSSTNESEAETETFWNRYKRQQSSKKETLGKLIKRALSVNVKTRPEVRKNRTAPEAEIAELNAEEEVYDELYADTYQDIYGSNMKVEQLKPLKRKSKQLKHRSVSEMIL